MKRNIFQMLFSVFSFTLSHVIIGQVPIYQIQGPHTEYEGPYYVRVFINYVQSPDKMWTQNVDLPSRTAGILDRLNSAYNQYNIYFIGDEKSPCDPAPYTVITQDSNFFYPSHLHPNALDIFDRGGENLFGGYAYSVPNTFCEISGVLDGIPASQSVVIVHEVGHCLGLSHTFTGQHKGECPDIGLLCSNGEPDCFCCGDYVCDTPPIESNRIIISADCSQSLSPAGLPVEIFRNYMSYCEPFSCCDRFTLGQIKRMWAYLTLAPALQNIRVPNIVYPNSLPSNISGNIVVESGEFHYKCCPVLPSELKKEQNWL